MEGTSTSTDGWISSEASRNLYYRLESVAESQGVSTHLKMETGIRPELYFRFIKKKMGTLERMKLNARIKRLEKAFYKAVDNKQIALSEKLLKEIARETRESVMFSKGIKHFIENDTLWKFKNRIRGGHISDTKFEDYTRVIPKEVLDKKKKVEELFDGFVIFHYWDNKAEEKREKKQEMTPDERAKMRDPVLFGVIRESNRLYFIADWEDEHCDLTFEEMIDVIGADEEEITIPREPKLS